MFFESWGFNETSHWLTLHEQVLERMRRGVLRKLISHPDAPQPTSLASCHLCVERGAPIWALQAGLVRAIAAVTDTIMHT